MAMPASVRIMAITTSNSINVNPLDLRFKKVPSYFAKSSAITVQGKRKTTGTANFKARFRSGKHAAHGPGMQTPRLSEDGRGV